ncbi:hypothetical protein HPP92_012886 [Vanilla planifolia]|uniref:Pectinesterase n=1 Tax=Vanilla planifolia TaxID=51239 RepID=A0A835R2H6_VANPL|nr:hypothetical protein HPP92_012886 [Vanilla planifolia]
MATRLLSFFFFLLVAPSWCTYAALLLSVASDGSGNFTTIREAIEFAPSGSSSRTTIMLKAGIYYENLVVPRDKENLTLLGEGSSVTVITGNRSHAGGWSMHDTATVYVEAAGFAAHNLTFQNTAGPSGGQAVALHVEGDRSVFYRCVINGYQDTLYAHNGHQFYRDCVILGTVDFIFGDAAAVFQNCTIFPVETMAEPSQRIRGPTTSKTRPSPSTDAR